MSRLSKAGIAAAVTAATGAIVFGGAALANADTEAPAPSASNAAPGYGAGPGGSSHTAVTGDELAKVTAAVKAKDSAVTVSQVLKDPDGSYDVLGTRSGVQVRYEVSADLKTITEGGGHGGGPGRGGSADTPVTGDELAKVTAAVKAKDSAVTVSQVRKDPDGSYDVFGTRSGAQVMYQVSADLKTITQNTGGAPHGNGAPAGAGQPTA